MHTSNLVIIEKPEGLSPTDPEFMAAIESAVAEAMGPSEEDGDGFWDWYQIGGRWAGSLDGYEPEKDPNNTERCDMCDGSGMRMDNIGRELRAQDPTFKCNSCHGEGKRVKWPTQWAKHPGDFQPVPVVTAEALTKFYRVVVRANGHRGVFGGQDYRPWLPISDGMFTDRELPPLEWIKAEFSDCLAVVVDSHN